MRKSTMVLVVNKVASVSSTKAGIRMSSKRISDVKDAGNNTGTSIDVGVTSTATKRTTTTATPVPVDGAVGEDNGNTNRSINNGSSKEGVSSQKKHWNDMLHMSIKRFQDTDPTLKPGANRNRTEDFPYIVLIEYDPSGRSTCKSCGTIIQPKGSIRASYMMECHKGYRTPCTVHYTDACFWNHREFSKCTSIDDITVHPSIIQKDPTFQSTFITKFHEIKKEDEKLTKE